MSRDLILAGYAVIVVGFVVAEALARRTGRWPTFGEALSRLVGSTPGRLLLAAGWLWVGWHVFVRSTPGG